MIHDDDYRSEMEGNNAASIIKSYEDMGLLFEGVSMVLLHALQGCHDDAEPEQWPEELDLIAELHHLKRAAA